MSPFSSEARGLLEDLSIRTTFAPGHGPLAVACSGGPDSTALAVLAVATGRPVVLHHVDHALRPTSAAEARHVEALANTLGVAFELHRVQVDAVGSPEESARLARRAVLPVDVATGHTMDDQAETVLINVLRGAGAAGLGGIEPGPTHPILAIRRSETHALCEACGLHVVTDESNDDLSFVRNAVRHRLLPLMAEISGRDPVPLLARTARHLRDDDELMIELAAAVIDDPTSTAQLTHAARPLAVRALRTWLSHDRPGGREDHPPSSAEVDRVLGVAHGDAVATELAGGVRVARRAGKLRMEHTVVASTIHEVERSGHQGDLPSWCAHDIGEVVLSGSQIQARVAELGAQITKDYAASPPLLVCVLKGAMLFVSDLSRAIELPVEVDFMAVSSYGSATKTSGVVRIIKDLDTDLTGRDVLVVEDIIDSGLTLNYLRKYLRARKPASVEVCALLLKEGEQRVEQDLRYVGFTIPSKFVVGYGLDAAERYRNLDGLYTYIGDGSDGP